MMAEFKAIMLFFILLKIQFVYQVKNERFCPLFQSEHHRNGIIHIHRFSFN